MHAIFLLCLLARTVVKVDRKVDIIICVKANKSLNRVISQLYVLTRPFCLLNSSRVLRKPLYDTAVLIT